MNTPIVPVHGGDIAAVTLGRIVDALGPELHSSLISAITRVRASATRGDGRVHLILATPDLIVLRHVEADDLDEIIEKGTFNLDNIVGWYDDPAETSCERTREPLLRLLAGGRGNAWDSAADLEARWTEALIAQVLTDADDGQRRLDKALAEGFVPTIIVATDPSTGRIAAEICRLPHSGRAAL